MPKMKEQKSKKPARANQLQRALDVLDKTYPHGCVIVTLTAAPTEEDPTRLVRGLQHNCSPQLAVAAMGECIKDLLRKYAPDALAAAERHMQPTQESPIVQQPRIALP